jgi:gamma-D-glutamyl-L-lysine dipeptidyl-peptidase
MNPGCTAERHMKYVVYQICILVVVGSLAFAQKTNHRRGGTINADIAPYIEAIRKVEEKVAPDRRVVLFEVKVHRTGKKIILTGEVGSSETITAIMDAVQSTGNSEIVDSLSILPEQSCIGESCAFVRVSVAPVRKKPSESAEMVTQALMGSVLKILKVKQNWLFIQMAEDNYLGWVDAAQCIRQTQKQVDRWMNGTLIMATANFDFIRTHPSDSAQSVCDVTTGALLEGKGYNQDWFFVTLPDGRTGFLPKMSGTDYAQWKSCRNPTPENIEKTAKIYLGVPYLWGGASPKGFDCSGFTKTVFKLNGISLQRDADQQGMAGVNVPLENNMSRLQKGDLIFFGRKPKRGTPERITHVGIYLGQQEFIHCSGMVKLNSFDPSSPLYNEYLLKKLVKAKRYLPEK